MGMNFSLEDVQSIIAAADQFKPLVKAGVDAVMLFGPEVKELLVGISEGAADIQAAMFKRLVDEHGFSREEALILVTKTFDRVQKTALNTSSRKSK